MHNQDIAQTYLSLKQHSNTRNSNHKEPKSVTKYKLNLREENSSNNSTHLSVPQGVIQDILGYPVIQVIFDEQGNVILDIGDLITYQAVERAIKANVFKILLDAVYMGK
ncbi:hypothetical protein [Gloeothece verrucosa]|uniref:Uncharacterized protein n=1 Tax=Gloeothece verrucosa (strain PCC 7822) TaxID=497965 RepID=E0U951_GLOV7|nr:hypothetical protein [Gloeothece verrucosa]ADN17309.1 hypothetical protein Cyan7822_5433 [Gloeothece verrucosa PCC 7822]